MAPLSVGLPSVDTATVGFRAARGPIARFVRALSVSASDSPLQDRFGQLGEHAVQQMETAGIDVVHASVDHLIGRRGSSAGSVRRRLMAWLCWLSVRHVMAAGLDDSGPLRRYAGTTDVATLHPSCWACCSTPTTAPSTATPAGRTAPQPGLGDEQRDQPFPP